MTTPSSMTGEVRIRKGVPEDLETLVRFNVDMAKETEERDLDVDTVRRGVAALFERPERGTYWVLEAGGAVVASLMVTREWSDWRCGEFWWIQSVYVAPEARRSGHFRRLYERVERLAASDPGVCGLRLYVEKDNHPAQRTYASLGMKETSYRLFEVDWAAHPAER